MPSGNAARLPRKPRAGAMEGPTKIRYERGLSRKVMAKRTKIPVGSLVAFELRRIKRNREDLPQIGEAYGMSPADVEAWLSQPAVERKTRDIVKKGKRLVHVPKQKGKALATTRAYDVERPIPQTIKKLLKALADTTNLNVLKGRRFLDLKSVPTRELAEMLGDYLVAKGISSHLILAHDYDDVLA